MRTPRWRSESAFADALYLLVRSHARSQPDDLRNQGGTVEELADVGVRAAHAEPLLRDVGGDPLEDRRGDSRREPLVGLGDPGGPLPDDMLPRVERLGGVGT